jgi:hypothetical protein
MVTLQRRREKFGHRKVCGHGCDGSITMVGRSSQLHVQYAGAGAKRLSARGKFHALIIDLRDGIHNGAQPHYLTSSPIDLYAMERLALGCMLCHAEY